LILGIGWTGLFFGSMAWLANLPFELSLVFFLLGRRWATLVSSGLALLLGFDTFRLFFTELPADEGGVGRLSLQALEPGAWLWLASLGATFAAAWSLLLAPRNFLPPVPRQ
jgi:hypothetical protein